MDTASLLTLLMILVLSAGAYVIIKRLSPGFSLGLGVASMVIISMVLGTALGGYVLPAIGGLIVAGASTVQRAAGAAPPPPPPSAGAPVIPPVVGTPGPGAPVTPTVTPTVLGVLDDPPAGGRKATIVNLPPGQRLRLREAPSAAAPILDRMDAGTVLVIVSQSGAWYQVRTPWGQTGYAHNSFLQLDGAAPPGAPQTTPPPPIVASVPAGVPLPRPGTVQTGGARLMLRSLPSETATILSRLPNGTSLTIIEDGPQWSRVQYSGQTGYVATRFLR